MSLIYLARPTNVESEFTDYVRVRIESSARVDNYNVHSICHKPEDADVILFASNYTFPPIGYGLKSEPVYNKFRDRVIMYDISDHPSPLFGGLCPSWHSDIDLGSGFALGWPYFHKNSAERHIEQQEWNSESRYLWSFRGSSVTHPIREQLLGLHDSDALVEDTSSISQLHLRGEGDAHEQQSFWREYIGLMKNSAFVVCPRGVGASSMRIFEAMRAGRAPVILSDDWTPPPFVEWDKCSLRVPEAEVKNLPQILRNNLERAQALGNMARSEWERVFGEEALFHHTVNACSMVLENRSNETRRQRHKRYVSSVEDPYGRALARYLIKRK